MAEVDWNTLSASQSAPSVARGVSAGFTPPNGGGSFVFGFNSKVTTPGAVGLYVNSTGNPDFAPLVDDASNPSGCSIRGTIKRGVSGGPLGFAPFFFAGLQGTTVNDMGYLLGLSDNDPHEIVLAKAAPVSNLDPTASNVLRKSTSTFLPDTWLHLRLDMIVNPNGDVVLRVFSSDLDSFTVSSPTWVAVPGMETFVDDALAVNSGSNPFTGGYAGFGFYSEELQRRGFFDHLEILRQTV
jgi:hypothetical protein